MIRLWFRALCLLSVFAFIFYAVHTAAALPQKAPSMQTGTKAQTPQVIFKVPTKHLPIKQIGEILSLKPPVTQTLTPPTAKLPPTPTPARNYQDFGQASGPNRVPLAESLVSRMTSSTQAATPDAPYYRKTWLAYYGRPNVPVMGILGEYDIEMLTALLREKAAIFDAANGPDIGVQPAFHLVYGMATRGANGDGSHLVFLDDDVVMAYIERAVLEGFAVILDIQIGALSPVDSIQRGLPYLQYPNVHLGIDPEFAMVHSDQQYPGTPIGYITGGQVNEVQNAMTQYLSTNGISEPRILLVHQFIDRMIVDKAAMSSGYPVDLTISVDGWGAPVEKIRRYNNFTSDYPVEFSAFKLFYRWDSPLMTERHALGVDSYANVITISTVPNMIIYQ